MPLQEVASCQDLPSEGSGHPQQASRHARTSTPAMSLRSFLATAPAATRPMVSLADERPPPATCSQHTGSSAVLLWHERPGMCMLMLADTC